MAILGNLVKSVLDLTSQIPMDINDPVKAQSRQLTGLLEKARDTAFGKYHDFNGILAASQPVEEFQARVPITDFHELESAWWKQQQRYPDITWPGKPDYFALSSGTTGKRSKRIPVTADMISSIRQVGMLMVSQLGHFDLPAKVFEQEILMLSSTADLKDRPDGVEEGEISGINVHNFPGWYELFYRPGKEIARIPTWDERLERIVREAPQWNISALAGIPSWIQLMLEAIKEEHHLSDIRQLWPELEIYASGGVAFAPYRQSFEALIGGPLKVVDTYLASEGFFACTTRPGTMSMQLADHHGIFYEFVPFDARGFDDQGNLLSDPQVSTIREVEEGQEYALIISTCAGAWRYMIGDTIKFTDLHRRELVISGRTKFFLNVVGSQLSEEKLNAAVRQLASQKGISIDEFCVAALKDEDDNYYHQWVLGTGGALDAQEASDILDRELQQANKNYRVARSKALRSVTAAVVPRNRFYDWLETRKKKGGQIKTPKVMSADRMKDFLSFLSND